MAALISTKPYLMRAIYEWCLDNALTPYLLVSVNAATKVPMGYVKDGEIVLSLGVSAIKDLIMDNDAVSFSARFGGQPHTIFVPIDAVKGLFAKENGQGMFFDIGQHEPQPPHESEEIAGLDAGQQDKLENKKKKPSLKIVK